MSVHGKFTIQVHTKVPDVVSRLYVGPIQYQWTEVQLGGETRFSSVEDLGFLSILFQSVLDHPPVYVTDAYLQFPDGMLKFSVWKHNIKLCVVRIHVVIKSVSSDDVAQLCCIEREKETLVVHHIAA